MDSHLQYDIAGSESMEAETSVDCTIRRSGCVTGRSAHGDQHSYSYQGRQREPHDRMGYHTMRLNLAYNTSSMSIRVRQKGGPKESLRK